MPPRMAGKLPTMLFELICDLFCSLLLLLNICVALVIRKIARAVTKPAVIAGQSNRAFGAVVREAWMFLNEGIEHWEVIMVHGVLCRSCVGILVHDFPIV